jgi:hypothetical protein
MALRWQLTKQTPRFALLLAAMFVQLLLAPIIVASPVGMAGARIVTGLVLVAALLAIGARRVSLVLFVVVITFHVLAFLRPEPWLEIAATVLRLAFLAYVCGLVILRVLSERNVSYDTLAGAACGYMLLGLIWGELYILTELALPGSFEIPASFRIGPDADPRASLLYFSFITLTTVGYGFMHPNNPGAGGLAASEALVGQFYLAVMVARLVGLHIANRGN